MNYNSEGYTHDQLQARCWRWAWNTYPVLQYRLFAVLNELPRAKGETKADHRIRVQQCRALGLVSGVLDLLLLWQPIHAFDIKIGGDKMSANQQSFCTQLTGIGGIWHEIKLFSQFQEIICNIVLEHH